MINLKNLNKKVLSNKRRSLKDQLVILENISLFLNRGYSLTDTLNLLKYRYDLEDYILDLEEGYLFSEILAKHKFDKDILLVLEIAETSGNLKLGVENSYLIIKQKIKNKEELIRMIKYPILLCIIAMGALGFVSLFLIPQFESIYTNFGIEDNKTITFLFSLIRNLPLIIFIILIILVILFIRFLKQDELKRLKFCLTNRLVKKSYKMLYNHIFTINLVNLLKVGLKLDEIFIILSKQKYNLLLQKESNKILNKLEEGLQLYECLVDKLYSKELIMLIKEGETFSTLLHNLDNYVVFLTQKQEEKTKKMLFIIQPIFYCFFGLLIVLLYATIFIPMFEMMESF